MFMTRLNFSQINSELEDIADVRSIDLFAFSTTDSLTFHYVCSAQDAIFILPMFEEDFEFIFSINLL